MSGAGKSTVCGRFRANGFKIVDCDGIARGAAQSREFLRELENAFPEKLLNENGSLDRAAAAALIFGDEHKRRLYNRAIFPYIIYEIMREIRSADSDVLLDAPTLFDAGLEMVCTSIVGVIAEAEICAERIIKRDGLTEEQACARLSSQGSADFFTERCDFTIENNGTERQLAERAAEIIDKLKGEK